MVGVGVSIDFVANVNTVAAGLTFFSMVTDTTNNTFGIHKLHVWESTKTKERETQNARQGLDGPSGR
jgi:hypothetical protein